MVNGGKTYRVIFFGGGEGRIECPLRNQFWRRQKVGFVWSVPVPLRQMTGCGQMGEKRIIGVGVQARLGGGGGGVLWCVFPLPEFPPPLCRCLKIEARKPTQNPEIPKEHHVYTNFFENFT